MPSFRLVVLLVLAGIWGGLAQTTAYAQWHACPIGWPITCPFPFAAAIPSAVCPGGTVQLSTVWSASGCSWSPADEVADPTSRATTAQPSRSTA